MIEFSRGDIVLIRFIFSDESGVKLRPAVVVSSADYQRRRSEAIILAITSQTDRLLIGDHFMADWKNAGLLFPSVVTGIIRTIRQDMVNRKLGHISAADLRAVEGNLQIMFDLE